MKKLMMFVTLAALMAFTTMPAMADGGGGYEAPGFGVALQAADTMDQSIEATQLAMTYTIIDHSDVGALAAPTLRPTGECSLAYSTDMGPLAPNSRADRSSAFTGGTSPKILRV